MQIINRIVKDKTMPTAQLIVICSWVLMVGGIGVSIYTCLDDFVAMGVRSFACVVGALLLRMIATIGEGILTTSYQAVHIRKNIDILKDMSITLREVNQTLQDVRRFFEELKQKIDIAD